MCSGIKSQQVKKNICQSIPKYLDFSQNSFVPFHRVTSDHSVACLLLIHKAIVLHQIQILLQIEIVSEIQIVLQIEIVLRQQRQMPQFHKLLQNA